MSSIRTSFKAWAAILLLSASLLVLAGSVSGDAEPNDTIANSESTTDFSNVVGSVDIGAGTPDIYDVYSLALTNGANGDYVQFNLSVTSLTPPCIMRVLTPTDNGYNFEVVNKTAFTDGVVNMNFNATVTGTYYLELMGGTFNYDGTDGHIQPGSNPGDSGMDIFSNARDIVFGDDSGSGQFIDGQNYVDIYSFSTTTGHLVDINFTGANIGAWDIFFLDSSFSPVSKDIKKGNGFWSCDFQEDTSSTYYIVLNSAYELLSTAGSYTWMSSIEPAPANMIPHISNPSIAPNTILSHQDREITFILDAVDTDGVVTDVNISCALWSGNWPLSPSTGNSWGALHKILASNVSSPGVYDVFAKVWDDDGEYNNSYIGNITVESGSVVYPDIGASIMMDEDDEDLYIYLDQYLEDIHKDLQDYIVWQNGYGVVGYFGDIFNASLYNATHVVIHLKEHQFGYDEFKVNVSYTDGSYVHIDFFVTVSSVNDIPEWRQFNFIEPARDPIDIDHNETIYIDLYEDIEYQMNITACDLEDGDSLLYGCNESNNDAFIMDDYGNIHFTPTQAYADVGVFRTEMWVYDIRIAGPANTTDVIFNISNVNDAPYGAELEYNINDQDPDQDGDNNLCVEFTVTRPEDEDGDTYFEYDFDFDDDGVPDITEGWTDDESIHATYTFPYAGEYFIWITIRDEGGLSTYVNATISVTEPTPEPEIEWWTSGFYLDDLAPDPDVEIDFVSASVVFELKRDTPEDGIISFTTTYRFAGTCSDDVVIIHIYNSYNSYDEDWYFPFYDPVDYMGQVEIEPSAGAWETVLTSVFEMDQDTYDDLVELSELNEVEEPVEPFYYLFLALGWTEDVRYNYDTIQVEQVIIDDNQEDKKVQEDPPIIDWDDPGDVTLVSMFALSAVVFVVAISLLIIVIVLKKKRRDRDGEEDVAREYSPY